MARRVPECHDAVFPHGAVCAGPRSGPVPLNAVDCVTQWKVVATVQVISDAHLPVIEQMLEQFPFEILGFHSDNGSEYVNCQVAKMRLEFTRSRPRRSNDNGLAESKNGAIVRKLFGDEQIPQRHAARFNTFCGEYLNALKNFHRPCLFATDKPDPKRPSRIRTEDVVTPLEKRVSLPDSAKSNTPRPAVISSRLRVLSG